MRLFASVNGLYCVIGFLLLVIGLLTWALFRLRADMALLRLQVKDVTDWNWRVYAALKSGFAYGGLCVVISHMRMAIDSLVDLHPEALKSAYEMPYWLRSVDHFLLELRDLVWPDKRTRPLEPSVMPIDWDLLFSVTNHELASRWRELESRSPNGISSPLGDAYLI